jgi:5-deoxy-glucuronate isomerase
MNLHIKSPGEKPGIYPIVERDKQLKFLSFTIVELGGNLREYALDSGDDELSLNFYTGPVTVEVAAESSKWRFEIGPRRSICEPGPMVYVPAGSNVKMTCPGDAARVTIAAAPGQPGLEPVLVSAAEAMKMSVGKENWTRTVYTHISSNVKAEHLIAGETVSRPGGWTSCPPHKHDRFAESSEVPMEEIYYFQVEPKQGFGFMRVYTDSDDPQPFDFAYAVQHGDTVAIPRGYHPVVACPGYTLNYTWVMAGERRVYGAWTDDPRHSWIKAA